MIFFFYFFAVILIALSIRSLLGGFEYLRFFREKLAERNNDFSPFATIFAPCKGLDRSLDKNLEALFLQNYPQYEIVFVVDDENDPATTVIRETIGKNSSIPAKLVIAPRAAGTSQKIANLIEAVKHANADAKALVFVDSDARPSENWLQALVAPLENEKTGASTGYRWFIAENTSIATEMRSAWNASIASALGPNTSSNFCWGGSMAIRKDVFERLKIAEAWAGALSDDFAVTRTVKNAGMNIEFVPAALTASVENCSFREMLEFTTRQMKITRVYSQHLWLLSWFGSGLFCSVMIAAAYLALSSDGLAWAAGLFTLAVVLTCTFGKAWVRVNAVKLALPNYQNDLDRQRKWQIALSLFTPVIFFYNSVAAALSRRMVWRGITYELKSPTETVIIAD